LRGKGFIGRLTRGSRFEIMVIELIYWRGPPGLAGNAAGDPSRRSVDRRSRGRAGFRGVTNAVKALDVVAAGLRAGRADRGRIWKW
jgi:hypothetical protein